VQAEEAQHGDDDDDKADDVDDVVHAGVPSGMLAALPASGRTDRGGVCSPDNDSTE
jgi:hypothetical protein